MSPSLAFSMKALQRVSDPTDQVTKNNTRESAQQGDDQGLGQKLDEDVPAARAERLFDADLSRALCDGDQHDVHQAYASDAESEQSDKAKQYFDSGRDDPQVKHVGKDIEYEDG